MAWKRFDVLLLRVFCCQLLLNLADWVTTINVTVVRTRLKKGETVIAFR